MRRIEPHFPLSHGVPRVDDRRIISGIIFVIRNGLRWRDAPAEYGPSKTIYNRFIRWSRMGVFNRIFAALSAEGGKPDQLMIDATHLKAHRTAASLLKFIKFTLTPMPCFRDAGGSERDLHLRPAAEQPSHIVRNTSPKIELISAPIYVAFAPNRLQTRPLFVAVSRTEAPVSRVF